MNHEMKVSARWKYLVCLDFVHVLTCWSKVITTQVQLIAASTLMCNFSFLKNCKGLLRRRSQKNWKHSSTMTRLKHLQAMLAAAGIIRMTWAVYMASRRSDLIGSHRVWAVAIRHLCSIYFSGSIQPHVALMPTDPTGRVSLRTYWLILRPLILRHVGSKNDDRRRIQNLAV